MILASKQHAATLWGLAIAFLIAIACAFAPTVAYAADEEATTPALDAQATETTVTSDDDPEAALTEKPDVPTTEETIAGEEPGEQDADEPDDETLDTAVETAAVTEKATDPDETLEEPASSETGAVETIEPDEDALSVEEARPAAKVTAVAHVQNKGWTDTKTLGTNSTIVGTTGQGLRMEALRFTVSGIGGTVQCQAHVQNVGWQSIVAAGKDAGTSGRALRVEAIRIALTGELSQWYEIAYRAHVQNKGWMEWKSDGQIAGTSGQGLRMEALEIKLTPKATKAAQPSDGIVGVRASAHVQNIGWQNQVNSGETTGTTGRSLRVEALRMALDAGTIGGGIELNSHVQNKGWLGYSANSTGTTGQGLRMEAVQLKLTGSIKDSYDIVYRAHVQNVGWQPWTLNGGTAGTEGKALRVEALQIKLVKKNSNQSVSEGTFFITMASAPTNALSSTGGSGAQATTTAYAASSMNERYYLRNESGGITLQSVGTGMFLEASGANVVQKAYSASNSAQVWTLAWNGGYAITNKATGKMLSLSGSKAVNGGSQRWMLGNTSLIGDGVYVVTNNAAGKVLDVNGASWKSGANIMVHDANGGGNQSFTFTSTGSDVYKVNCAMTGKAVDVANGSTANGANVQQYSANGSNAQLWKANIDRSGSFTFTNRASGKLLSAAGSGASNANVCSTANTGGSTQKWTLKASSYQPDTVLQRAMGIAENLSSSTSYFIAVDLSNHRTVVMQGSRGNWEPIQNWTVSTGAPSSPTVVGDYTIGSRGYSFGHGYTCYYWTQFYGDYLFHSVLYNEGTRTIQDGRLGYSISQGCVRMAIENAKWINDVIPSGTHVKTYY